MLTSATVVQYKQLHTTVMSNEHVQPYVISALGCVT